MRIVVVSGLPLQAIQARGGLPVYAHLQGKPINFDWLQGFMTALIPASSRWHSRDAQSSQQKSLSVDAEPVAMPDRDATGIPQ